MIDLVGKAFGELTVYGRAVQRSREGLIQWLCRCSCGRNVVRIGKTLRRDGRHMSCGCHLRKRKRMVTEDTKQCKECLAVKHVSEFQRLTHPDRSGASEYWAARCKACSAEYNRMLRYGISLAGLIEKQCSPICPLCLKRLANCIDHDHATGETRGAVCQRCNKGLHFVDDREWLKRAEAYRCQQSPKLNVVSSTA